MIRVLVADDHKVVRQGLRFLLSSEPGIEVIGEASPSLIIVEDPLPDMSAADFCRHTRACREGANAIILVITKVGGADTSRISVTGEAVKIKGPCAGCRHNYSAPPA